MAETTTKNQRTNMHLHTLISKFVRCYRDEIEPFLKTGGRNSLVEVRIRNHCLAGKIATGMQENNYHILEYLDFRGISPDAGGTYMNAIIILGGLHEDLKQGRSLDNTSFLELQRAVSEIEFLLSNDPHYKQVIGAAA